MSMRTNTCPCCGGSLLRHVRHGGLYWFCSSCWQEVPSLTISKLPRPEPVAKAMRQQQPVNS